MNDAVLILGTGSHYHPIKRANRREFVAIPVRSLMHTHVIGKSGYGKSYWLALFYVMLLSRGFSVTLIDPAGDLSALVLKQLIATGFFSDFPDAFSRVVYLNIPAAARRGLYVPFNILDTPYDPYTISDMVLEAFRRAFPALKNGTSSNIEMLIKIGSFVLAANKLPLLPYLYYLFANAEFREKMLSTITDEVIVSSFAQYGFTRSGQVPPSMLPTLNRLYRVAFSPTLRYSLGQHKNVLSFRRLIDEGRSVIINLNTSPDVKRLLGCLYTVYAEMGARSRGEIPAHRRTGKHMLILDEFQNFVAHSGDALSSIFEECRKYGLFLCLAHQHWGQIPETLSGALRQCELSLTFHLDRPDAEVSEKALGFPFIERLLKEPEFNPLNPMPLTPHYYSRAEQRDKHIDNIVGLDKQEAIARLTNGHFFRMRTIDVDDSAVTGRTFSYVEDAYFKKYFHSQNVVDATINLQLSSLITRTDAVPADDTIKNNEPQRREQQLYYGENDYNLF